MNYYPLHCLCEEGAPEFFRKAKGGGQEFFLRRQRGGPEKIGNQPSQANGTLPLKEHPEGTKKLRSPSWEKILVPPSVTLKEFWSPLWPTEKKWSRPLTTPKNSGPPTNRCPPPGKNDSSLTHTELAVSHSKHVGISQNPHGLRLELLSYYTNNDSDCQNDGGC